MCEDDDRLDHYTHVISLNSTEKGFYLLSFVNFERFNL